MVRRTRIAALLTLAMINVFTLAAGVVVVRMLPARLAALRVPSVAAGQLGGAGTVLATGTERCALPTAACRRATSTAHWQASAGYSRKRRAECLASSAPASKSRRSRRSRPRSPSAVRCVTPRLLKKARAAETSQYCRSFSKHELAEVFPKFA